MRIRVLVFGMIVAGLALLAACDGGGGEQSTPTASVGDGIELTREQVIQRALEIIQAQPDNQPDASTATATRMTEREAVEAIQRAGVSGRPATPVGDKPVWLAEVRGEFVGFIPGPARQGRYFLILDLDGVSYSGAFIPDATPTP